MGKYNESIVFHYVLGKCAKKLYLYRKKARNNKYKTKLIIQKHNNMKYRLCWWTSIRKKSIKTHTDYKQTQTIVMEAYHVKSCHHYDDRMSYLRSGNNGLRDPVGAVVAIGHG